MPEQTDITYEQAHERLEAIVQKLDSGSPSLRETLDLCREGRSLLEFCAKELESVSRGLDELRLEELLTQLENGASESERNAG